MDINLQNAYKICADICVNHYENFPVASRLIPNELRPHVYAIYAFARTADDFADEPGLTPQERLTKLDDWEKYLRYRVQNKDVILTPESINRGEESPGVKYGERRDSSALPQNDINIFDVTDAKNAMDSMTQRTYYIFLALADTIKKFNLPLNLFTDLLQAFKMDVTKTRYKNWDEVMFYCRHSANPVGRLILALFGERGEKKEEMSDAICTALQLTNFWQDLEIDFKKGRIYLPLEDMAKFGVEEGDIGAGRVTTAYRNLINFEAERTRKIFDLGRGLCDEVTPKLGRELRLVWLGGMRILERLRDINFDVFRHRPALNLKDKIIIGARALKW